MQTVEECERAGRLSAAGLAAQMKDPEQIKQMEQIAGL